MNKPEDILRESIQEVQSKNIKVLPGAWFEFSTENKIISCCPIGAVILNHNRYQSHGLVKIACELLGVDTYWIRRFWLGFDRKYQVMIEIEKDDKKVWIKDNVALFGISLRRELKI